MTLLGMNRVFFFAFLSRLYRMLSHVSTPFYYSSIHWRQEAFIKKALLPESELESNGHVFVI
jgi:hypothetical protein